MLILTMLVVFVAAVGLIGAATIFGFRFAGMALNRVRPRAQRTAFGLAAAGCALGVVAAAAAGFSGVSAVMYQAELEERDGR